MKKVIILFLMFLITVFAVSSVYLAYKVEEGKTPSLDIVIVNDITQSVKSNWGNLTQMSSLVDKYGLDYYVLGSDNQVIVKTSDELNGDLNFAISHRDTIVDIYDKDVLLGKLVIYNDYNESLVTHKRDVYITCFVVILLFILLCIAFVYYIYWVVYRPFKRLQNFARNVAAGDLDIPLEMDKQNVFGAFTESFDLMRDELKSAREAEQQANKSKKELVAQLSHDIKTPVASIKAVSELLIAKATSDKASENVGERLDEVKRRQSDISNLDIIGKKADQINTLITNMFNATLEELKELKVYPEEQSSLELYDIISSADYFNKIGNIEIDECLIYADINRLTQVIDNIVSNSYKYAGTDIKIKSYFENEYLVIEFTDYGNGVEADELPLLFNKFYRAKNSDGKSGAGLGLYISRYLMNKMDGDIVCENINNGFKIILMIKLV